MGLSSFVGNLTGGLIGESDVERAAKAGIRRSEQATNEAKGYVDEGWDYISDSLDPYASLGTKYMQEIAGMPDYEPLTFSFTEDDFRADPGYQFRLDESDRALDRLAGKNRNLTSGGRITAALDRAGGLADQTYADAWARAFQETTYNNSALMQGYAANLGRRSYLADTGFGATRQLNDYKYRSGTDKGNLALGHAANSTAADMFQAQNKSQFVSDLIQGGSKVAAAAYGAPD